MNSTFPKVRDHILTLEQFDLLVREIPRFQRFQVVLQVLEKVSQVGEGSVKLTNTDGRREAFLGHVERVGPSGHARPQSRGPFLTWLHLLRLITCRFFPTPTEKLHPVLVQKPHNHFQVLAERGQIHVRIVRIRIGDFNRNRLMLANGDGHRRNEGPLPLPLA
uniref:(northern house mosquito) hypothetical protein n=1 Tax=Culex pipiens TaxID=7175 RepID=A0A8D8DAT6_CULPI